MTEWLAEAAKTNRFLEKLTVAESKGNAAYAASWVTEMEGIATGDDPKTKKRANAAAEAVVLTLAHGTPLIPKNMTRALTVACAAKFNADAPHAFGRLAADVDEEAAVEAVLALKETRPDDAVLLATFITEVDPEAAGKLFGDAMQRPELRSDALVAYGFMLCDETPPDHKRAFCAFREACDMYEKGGKEKPTAAARSMLVRLAEMYEKGEGTEKDAKKTYYLATLAAAIHRHCAGKRLLARCLEEGIGCKKSPKKAAKELRELSKDCYCAHTLCQLARLHHEEVVTSKEALKWLQDAVGQDPEHAESWYEKGLLHRDGGKGIAQQAKEAEKCFLAGAEFGNRNCMYELYEMYLPVERPEGFGWLLNAAVAGHNAAAEAVGSVCLKRDEELARFWLSKAPASASAKKKLATLGKEKEATMDEHLARIAAAMAKIPTHKLIVKY